MGSATAPRHHLSDGPRGSPWSPPSFFHSNPCPYGLVVQTHLSRNSPSLGAGPSSPRRVGATVGMHRGGRRWASGHPMDRGTLTFANLDVQPLLSSVGLLSEVAYGHCNWSVRSNKLPLPAAHPENDPDKLKGHRARRMPSGEQLAAAEELARFSGRGTRHLVERGLPSPGGARTA